MKYITGTFTALLILAMTASTAHAQTRPADSWVLQSGVARFGIGVEYSHFDRRFGSGSTERLAADLTGPLNATTFAPLATVRERIDGFFAATGGGSAIDPGALTLGSPDVDLSADVTWVPLELTAGVLPRLEIGVTVPLYRSELQVSRFVLSGGNVGANPAPEANAAALAAFGAEFEALGRGRLLPLAGSPVGAELQRRVAAAGGQLQLPESAAGDSLLNVLLVQELGMPPLETSRETWRLGDVEARAAVRLLSTFGGAVFPADPAPLHYRLSGLLGFRFPTGSSPDPLRLFSPTPSAGLTGWNFGFAGDVFVGDRFWVGALAGYASAKRADVLRRVVPPDQPFSSAEAPQVVSWSPPSELRIRVSPRWRLEESISLGLDYQLLSLGGSSHEGAGGAAAVLDIPGGAVQRLGGSVRFTTLPGYFARGGSRPFEASIAYARTLTGPSDYPSAATLAVEGRLYHRIWGRGLHR